MNKGGKKLILIPVVILLAALIIFRLMHKEAVVEEETRPMVGTELPVVKDIVVKTEAIGTLEPEQEVSVMPKMAGEVTSVQFAVGDRVEQGQTLITIHSDALDSLKIAVDSAKIQMTDAQTALQRTQALAATGAVSQQQLEAAQSAAKSTKLAFENAETQLKLQTEYTTVMAPIAGVIETKSVNEHDQASPAMPICTINGGNGMSVTFGVTGHLHNSLKTGDTVEIVKDQEHLTGKITEVSDKVSPTSGLFSCKASVSLSGSLTAPALTNGERAKVILVSDHAEKALTIPVASIFYADGAPYVYVLKDAHAVRTDIETGLFDETSMQVTSGITAEDRVITTWSNEIYNGVEVRTAE